MRGAGRNRALAVCLVGLAAYALWAKVRLYGHLEYKLDLFGFLQMATAPLDGRLPLFENGWGRHAAIHNYFTVPMLLPAAALLGAGGLFLCLVAAGLGAIATLARLAGPLPPERRRLVEIVTLAFFVSPVAFWVLDDAPYGFHPELFFAPLAVVFGVGLIRRARWAWVAGALLALTREDGPLVALAVHLTVSVALAEAEPARSPGRRLGAWLGPVVSWGTVFVLGIGLLQLQAAGEAGGSRAAGALSSLLALADRPSIRAGAVGSALTGLAILGSGAAVVLAGISLRPVIVAGVASLPLFGTQVLGGLAANYSSPAAAYFHGVSWASRIAALWGVLAVALVTSAVVSPLRHPLRSRTVETLGVVSVVLSFVLQATVLSERRFWEVARRLDPVRLLTGEGFFVSRLSSEEDAVLRILSRELPPKTPIAATPTLFARFDAHDLVWPDRADEAWCPPVVVVCDTEATEVDDRGCVGLLARVQSGGWVRFSTGRVSAASVPALGPAVSRAFGGGTAGRTAAEKRAASAGTADTRSGKPKR